MQRSEPSDDLQRILYDDEELQWVVGIHQKARVAEKLPPILATGAMAGILAGILANSFMERFDIAVLVFLAVTVLIVGGSVWAMLLYDCEYAATDQRLIRYQGIFGRTLDSIPFEGIQDAEYTISAIENFFDVGTVTVDSDRGYEPMTCWKVPGPEAFTREVVQLAQSANDGE